MKNLTFKKLLPHLVAVIVFLIVALVYCKPALNGEVIGQHDIQQWRGMAQQSFEFKDKNGHFPLWTNSMFGGMPAYQIAFDSRTNISVGYLQSVFTLGLPKPVNYFFLACICFYFLCVVAGANPWLGILGGLGFAYSTFDPIIIAVGHDTQMWSIAYMPAVIAGIWLLLKRKYLAGFAVTALFSSLLILQNHIQVVYYTLIIAMIMVIGFCIKSYKEKQIGTAIKSASLALIAGIIGFATCAVIMLPNLEYAKESMRGGRSELTLGDKSVKTKGGLDKDYAFNYSLGLGETFTFLIPGLYGGSNGGDEYTSPTKFTEKFTELGVPEEQALQYENSRSYWGEQPFTSGPVYLGAIICLLFIFGLVYLKDWYKWWLLTASLVGVILAWGANMKGINFFLFDYLPFYNKFRAPTMALIIPQFCFPLLAVMAVNGFINEKTFSADTWKKLRLTGIITGGLLLLMAGFYFSASFSSTNDKLFKESIEQNILSQVPPGQAIPPQLEQQAQMMSRDIMVALQSDRKGLMGKDLARSAILIILASGLIVLYYRKNIGAPVLVAGLIVLTGYDLLGVATRYLNSSKYMEENQYEAAFAPSAADNMIKQDPNHANVRVFNQTVDPFNDASTSYHHNSVGGYHAAKLGLYNDLILWQLGKGNMNVFNMLNTKYFIVNDPQTRAPVAQINPDAYGNVWLVKGIKFVETADEEMLALNDTNLKDTLVVENKFKSLIKTLPTADSTASIVLKENLNDQIVYTYKSHTPQVAVFSEIYYHGGWNAYIDGQKSDYFKADYLLRAMYLPAGDHTVEFKFEPESFWTGRMISIIASIIVIISVLMALLLPFIRKNKAS